MHKITAVRRQGQFVTSADGDRIGTFDKILINGQKLGGDGNVVIAVDDYAVDAPNDTLRLTIWER